MQVWFQHFGRLLGAVTRSRAPTADTAKAATGPLIAIDGLGAPVWNSREYGAFAREGMMRNPVVYRCVRMIAEAAASAAHSGSRCAMWPGSTVIVMSNR